MQAQGADPAPPGTDPARLIGCQVWRFTQSSGWLRGCVALWRPEIAKHRVMYNAGTELEFQEELDLSDTSVMVSWRDPQKLVPAPAPTPSAVTAPGAAAFGSAQPTPAASDVEMSFADNMQQVSVIAHCLQILLETMALLCTASPGITYAAWLEREHCCHSVILWLLTHC